jgi:hypothetical protein
MITLETYQRGLLDLVKNRGVPPTDPYLRQIASCPELVLVREIAVWWRAFQIETQCPLVARVLKHYGCFNRTVTQYFDGNHTSPFVEELIHHFLGTFSEHTDPFLRSVSRFEHALLRARAGSEETYVVLFDRNPDLAFLTMEKTGRLPPTENGFIYRVNVDPHLPGMIRCTREQSIGEGETTKVYDE